MRCIAHDVRTTSQHLDDILNDGRAKMGSMSGVVMPPGTLGLKQLFDRTDSTNDEFGSRNRKKKSYQNRDA